MVDGDIQEPDSHDNSDCTWKCADGLVTYAARPEPFDDPLVQFARYKPVYCTGCKRGRELKAEQAVREAVARRSYLLEQSDLPVAGVFVELSLESFARSVNGTAEWFEAVKTWVESWQPGSSRGLTLYGGHGVGKTGLITAALKELIERRCATVFYITITDFSERVGEAWAERNGQEHHLLKKMCETDILFLDEVGAGHASIREYGDITPLGRLFGVIDYRYRHGKPLVLATNCATPAELMAVLGERNFNRIYETCSGLLCDGKNLRS